MSRVEVLGVVQDVYRRCRACGEWKTLNHYVCHAFCRNKHEHNQKICAQCRGKRTRA